MTSGGSLLKNSQYLEIHQSADRVICRLASATPTRRPAGPLGTLFTNPITLEMSDLARGNPDNLVNRVIEKEILVVVTAEEGKGETAVPGDAPRRRGGA